MSNAATASAKPVRVLILAVVCACQQPGLDRSAVTITTTTIAPSSTAPVTHAYPVRKAYSYSGRVTETFDKFDDYTSISSAELPTNWTDKYRDGKLTVQVNFIFDGRALVVDPTQVSFRLIYQNDDWQFLTYRPLVLLLDDSIKMVLGEPKHDGTVGNGYVLEQMRVTLLTGQFLQIVNANRIEGKLGIREFVLPKQTLNGLRDLASRMNPNAEKQLIRTKTP